MGYLGSPANSRWGTVVRPLWADRALLEELLDRNDAVGWANYEDTQYTTGSPFLLSANTDTQFPNNGVGGDKSQIPFNVIMYDPATQLIDGSIGDGVALMVSFTIRPTQAGTLYIDVWLDIGVGVHSHRQIFTFPRGQGVDRHVHHTIIGGVVSDWATNGAKVFMRTPGTADIFDIEYEISIFHKNR